jgi:hypothetical protein
MARSWRQSRVRASHHERSGLLDTVCEPQPSCLPSGARGQGDRQRVLDDRPHLRVAAEVLRNWT